MKNTIKQYTLGVAARLLLDGQLWSDVKMFCYDAANNDNLSNEEKHAKVKKDLQSIFTKVGSVILNLAIELGTLWVQSQAQKNNS